MGSYEHQHIVSFEETNLVGNVYYINYLRWQGHCREMFIRDHAPTVLARLSQDLAIATVRVSCDYFVELFAFDRVAIRMHLASLTQNLITMIFEYWRLEGDGKELVARGEQQVPSMERQGDKLAPTPIPEELRLALQAYAS